MTTPHILVIGGGAGGLPLVTLLGRKLGHSGKARVTLVDSNTFHVWKPRFHEVATGAIDADLDAVDYRAHARLNGYRFEQGCLQSADTAARTVTLASLQDSDGNQVLPERTLDYDYLVIAIGSRCNDFGTPGVKEHALFMDSLTQADRFRETFLNACLNANFYNRELSIAIVGGGATGVELAAETHHAVDMLKLYGHEHLASDRLKVTVIEAAPRILPILPERLSNAATLQLRKMGVTVLTDTAVARAEPGAFVTKDEQRINADILVWAAGVKAPEVLTRISGVTLNRIQQIDVEPTLQAKGLNNVFVIGDSACCVLKEGERPLPPRAQTAQQMAKHLAREITRQVRSGHEPRPFEYRDQGSLVSLSKYSSVGTLMGNLKSGNFFVEGWLARMMYISLYRLHQATLYGWPRTLMLLLAGRFSRLVRPRMKLH